MTERAVAVNQKALIENIISRYAGEFAVYRELAQNADDADADQFAIRFATTTAAADPATTRWISEIRLENNGKNFNASDWTRVVSIADGNPDESKIGFFGVGFYSVFSVSDAPRVDSGVKFIDFRWKGPSLYFLEDVVPAEREVKGARITLPCRPSSLSPLPPVDSFSAFCSGLLLFTRNLRRILVTVDGAPWIVVEREDAVRAPLAVHARFSAPSEPAAKPAAPSSSAPLAKPAVSSASVSQSIWRMFSPHVTSKSIASGPSSSGGGVGHSLLPPPSEEPFLFQTATHGRFSLETVVRALGAEGDESRVRLEFVRAHSRVLSRLESDLTQELERIMKKKPPANFALEIVTCSDPFRAVFASDAVSNALYPARAKGRVFVGFTTEQTTGWGAHLNGPFIPTMERSTLDISGAATGTWNMKLLRMAGVLSRALHEHTVREALKTRVRVVLPPPPLPMEDAKASPPKTDAVPAEPTRPDSSAPTQAPGKKPVRNWFGGASLASFFSAVVPTSQATDAPGFSLFEPALTPAQREAQERARVEAESKADDEGLLTHSLSEYSTDSIIVASMATFAQTFEEGCAPIKSVGAEIWTGFLDGGSGGPSVYTSVDGAVSSSAEDCRLSGEDGAAEFVLETKRVIPLFVSRARPSLWRSVGALASRYCASLARSGELKVLGTEDVRGELLRRPLRGLEEAVRFVAWLDKRTEFIVVACGNRACGSRLRVEASAPSVLCPVCRRTSVFHHHSAYAHASTPTVLAQELFRAMRVLDAWSDQAKGTICEAKRWSKQLHASLLEVLAADDAGAALKLVDAIIDRSFIVPPALYPAATGGSEMGVVSHVTEPLRPMDLCVRYFERTNPREREESRTYELLSLVASLKDAEALADAVEALRKMPCVPTTQGLKRPNEAYALPSDAEALSVLPDIPMLTIQCPTKLVPFLVEKLKVRDVIDSNTLLDAFEAGKLSTLPREVLLDLVCNAAVSGSESENKQTLVRLSNTKIFPCQGVPNSGYKFSQLLLPTPENLTLCDIIAVADGQVYERTSEATKRFLGKSLFVPQPSLKELCKHAGDPAKSEDARLRAIRFALELDRKNASSEAASWFSGWEKSATADLKLAARDFACVPVIQGETKPAWARPSDCSVAGVAWIPQFPRVRELDPGQAERLGVPKEVPADVLVSRLLPSGDVTEEMQWARIEDVAKRVTELSSSAIDKLRGAAIVPIPPSCKRYASSSVRFVAPSAVFLREGGEESRDADDGASSYGSSTLEARLESIFVVVSRSQRSKEVLDLLSRCGGGREVPTARELVEVVLEGPARALEDLGLEGYLELLRAVAQAWGAVPSNLRTSLASSTCLIGLSMSVQGETLPRLLRASEVAVDDDARMKKLFAAEQPTCPREPGLEAMYAKLGSPALSALIKVEYQPQNKQRAAKTPETQKLMSLLEERAHLLLKAADAQGAGLSKLACAQVPRIVATYRLGRVAKSDATTACVCPAEGRAGHYQLFVTPDFDMFEVAETMGVYWRSIGALQRAPSREDFWFWDSLLKSSRAQLESKGFTLPPIVPPPSVIRTAEPAPPTVRPAEPAPPSAQVVGAVDPSVPVAAVASAVPVAKVVQPDAPPPPPQDPKGSGDRPDDDPPNSALETAVPVADVARSEAPPSMLPEKTTVFPSNPDPGRSAPSSKSLMERFGQSVLPKFSPPPDFSAKLRSEQRAPPPLGSSSTSQGPMGNVERLGNRRNEIAQGLDRTNQQASLTPPPSSVSGMSSPESAPASSSSAFHRSAPLMDDLADVDLVRAQDRDDVPLALYVHRSQLHEQPFVDHNQDAKGFSKLIVGLAIEVFRVDISAVHLYWHAHGRTAAFNRGGMLYFNLWVFVNARHATESYSNVALYWYGVFAHELAHNHHGPHDATFARYIEIYATEFGGRLSEYLHLRGLYWPEPSN